MKPTAGQIWREVRRAENSFRFHSDMVLGLIDQLKEIGGGDRDHVAYSNGPVNRPGPQCIPPWPCPTSIREAIKLAAETRKWANQALDGVVDLLEHAQAEGIDKVRFRPSQLPVYPEGSSGTPPEHRRASGSATRARSARKKRTAVTSRV